MKLKILMAAGALGLTVFSAQANSTVREPLPSATFSSTLDKGTFEQKRFSVLSFFGGDESKAPEAAAPKRRETFSAQAIESDDDVAIDGMGKFSMLMAGLGVVAFLASRRKMD